MGELCSWFLVAVIGIHWSMRHFTHACTFLAVFHFEFIVMHFCHCILYRSTLQVVLSVLNVACVFISACCSHSILSCMRARLALSLTLTRNVSASFPAFFSKQRHSSSSLPHFSLPSSYPSRASLPSARTSLGLPRPLRAPSFTSSSSSSATTSATSQRAPARSRPPRASSARRSAQHSRLSLGLLHGQFCARTRRLPWGHS